MFDTDLPIYGIFILISLFSNLMVTMLIYKKFNFTLKEVVCLLIYEYMGIIIGAKILNFIQNYSYYNGDFDFLTAGLSSYGAVIGAFLLLGLFCFQFKKSIKEVVNLFLPSIPLMYGISKLACFFSGCCYGFYYSGFGSVTYNYSISAPANVSLFPVQLLESILFILIFIYIINLVLKEKYNLKYIGITLMLCSFTKFSLDFLRCTDYNSLVSINKIIGVIFFIIGFIIFKKNYKSER